MYKDFNSYRDKEQKKRIESIIDSLEKLNMNVEDMDLDQLRRYFIEDDVFVVINMQLRFNINEIMKLLEGSNSKKKVALNKSSKINKQEPRFNKITQIHMRNKEFNLEWEKVTPYIILGIEEREYTKEELLDIVEKRIDFIKNHESDTKTIIKNIDSILDAYNELTKESHKQR